MIGSRRSGSAPGGFTLLEAVVVVALLGILAGFAFPAIQRMIHRGKLQGLVGETATLLRLARLEAIRAGRPGRVEVDTAGQQITGYLDSDADGTLGPGERRLGFQRLPAGVGFTAPPDTGGIDSIEGFEKLGQVAMVDFASDGAAAAAGAVRFADGRGNFLEVRVAPRSTGRVVVRKWDGAAWREEGEGGVPWTWQ